jgi:hypothetical protein
MLTRRRFVGYSALSSAMLAYPGLLRSGLAQSRAKLRVAVIGSTYKRQSVMQMITDRFLVGYPYDGEWHMPNVEVVSMYVDRQQRLFAARPTAFDSAMTDTRVAFAGTTAADRARGATGAANRGTELQQRGRGVPPGFVPPEDPSDLSPSRAQEFNFKLYKSIQDAIRCGTSKISVDAVLAIPEPDDYELNENGQELVPSFDFFQQCALVFEEEKHPIPYFNYGPLSYSYSQAQMMVKSSDRLKFPLLAGSSVPVTWRLPEAEIPSGAVVHEAVIVGANTWGGTDFDGLEAMQAMLERRKGGETGVKAVQLLEGDDVWTAYAAGRWSKDLLSSALSRSDTPLGLTLLDGRTQDLAADSVLQQLAKNPIAYCVEYTDGTKATLLMLDGAIEDFNISARVEGHGNISTQFLRPWPPNQLANACLTAKVEQMYSTKSAPYSAKRTLLTSGILEACMESKRKLNTRIVTPHLTISYQAPAESQYTRT